jgi:hypothetical protein
MLAGMSLIIAVGALVRSPMVPVEDTSESGHEADPLQEQAAEAFTEQLSADRIPSVRAIRAQLHVG